MRKQSFSPMKTKNPKKATPRKFKKIELLHCWDCNNIVKPEHDKDWCSGCTKVAHGISESLCGGANFCVCGEPICPTCKTDDVHCKGSSKL